VLLYVVNVHPVLVMEDCCKSEYLILLSLVAHASIESTGCTLST
jgi:hypothetical protein